MKTTTQEEWLEARRALLAKEKALTHAREDVAEARRALPAVVVKESYVFEDASGPRTLLDLFEGRRQLLVYHLMFAPEWDAACKSCSFIADGFDGALPHLAARDTSFVAISRAPLAKLAAFEKRMGWGFRWLSSGEGPFNYDFRVAYRPEDRTDGQVDYNYGRRSFGQSDAPGLSVFLREGDRVLHTYSTYGRGLDPLMMAYHYLDLTPLGRQEADLPQTMAWVRHHDRYAD